MQQNLDIGIIDNIICMLIITQFAQTRQLSKRLVPLGLGVIELLENISHAGQPTGALYVNLCRGKLER